MPHAELCPVCKGSGRLDLFGVSANVPPTTVQCHGCTGLGWVAVPDICEIVEQVHPVRVVKLPEPLT